MNSFKPPMNEWPRPCFKNGDVKYAHNDKELVKFTTSEDKGGLGYTLAYTWQPFPKMVYRGEGSAIAQNQFQLDQLLLQGYGFQRSEPVIQAPQSTPPAAPYDEIEQLKRKNAELEAMLASRSNVKASKGRPRKVQPVTEVA